MVETVEANFFMLKIKNWMFSAIIMFALMTLYINHSVFFVLGTVDCA
jgi:hypothetical protein